MNMGLRVSKNFIEPEKSTLTKEDARLELGKVMKKIIYYDGVYHKIDKAEELMSELFTRKRELLSILNEKN